MAVIGHRKSRNPGIGYEEYFIGKPAGVCGDYHGVLPPSRWYGSGHRNLVFIFFFVFVFVILQSHQPPVFCGFQPGQNSKTPVFFQQEPFHHVPPPSFDFAFRCPSYPGAGRKGRSSRLAVFGCCVVVV